MNRIVLLIDMDCFYVQVEQRDRPETHGKPCAVAQYNGVTGGGIIAVSYEARALGIKRGMWGKTALKACKDLILFEVPEKRGKADLNKYRAAGAEVINCITEFLDNVERASIDEAYVDLTDFITDKLATQDPHSAALETTPTEEAFVLAHLEVIEKHPAVLGSTHSSPVSVSLNRLDWMDFLRDNYLDGERYALASTFTYHIRQTILRRTGFKCSAGIAPNKTLAKLACSLNKPNKQTIVPPDVAPFLVQSTPVMKIRNLGGKLGTAIVSRYGIENLGQLTEIGLPELIKEFGEKTGQWLYDLCRGHDTEPVTARQIPQSFGCSKNFPGRSALATTETIQHWLHNLAGELVERLQADRREHRRQATRLTLHVRTDTVSKNGSFSRVLPSILVSSIGAAMGTKPLPSTTTGNPSCSTHEDRIAQAALRVLQEQFQSTENSSTWKIPITLLAFTVGKFVSDFSTESGDLRSMLMHQSTVTTNTDNSSVIDPAVSAAEGSPAKLERKSSSTRQECVSSIEATTSGTSTLTTTTVGPFSFFKRLRVAELSEPTNPSVTVVSNQSPIAKQKSMHEPTEKNPISSIKPDPNARVLENSDVPDIYFTSYSVGDWVVCDECGSRISVWQVPEHSDFHVAQRVQLEWTREADRNSICTEQLRPTTSASSDASATLLSKTKCDKQSDQNGRSTVKNRQSSVHSNRKPRTTCVGTLDRFIRSSRSS